MQGRAKRLSERIKEAALAGYDFVRNNFKQASSATDPGYVTKVQMEGVILDPLHPLEMAIALGAGFVARGYSLDIEHLSWLISEGIKHKGFSLIDVLQPCVSFNKKNTYEWYTQRVYKDNDDSSYNPEDKMAAYENADD